MGMYTELVLKFEIDEDIDPKAMLVLRRLFNNEYLEEDSLPDHPFFKCHRWGFIGKSSSFYHHPSSVNDWYVSPSGGVYVFSRSDLKNYGDEIELFIDWVKPYIKPSTGNCLGWYWYEEDNAPTLIMIDEE